MTSEANQVNENIETKKLVYEGYVTVNPYLLENRDEYKEYPIALDNSEASGLSEHEMEVDGIPVEYFTELETIIENLISLSSQHKKIKIMIEELK